MTTNDKQHLGVACALAGTGLILTYPAIIVGAAVAVVVVIGGAIFVGRAVQ